MTDNATNSYSASDVARMIADGDYVPTVATTDEIPHTLDPGFWQTAKVVMPSAEAKVPISMRLDPEVLAWFRQGGKGYLSRMNAVLRAYVDAQQVPRP
jgi:uncharacterized protein (DUF4415 family)